MCFHLSSSRSSHLCIPTIPSVHSIVPDPWLAAGWEAAIRSLESCGGSLIGSLASVIIVIRFGNFEREGRCIWETPPSLRHRPERSWRAGPHYSLATRTTHSLHFASDQPTNQPVHITTDDPSHSHSHLLAYPDRDPFRAPTHDPVLESSRQSNTNSLKPAATRDICWSPLSEPVSPATHSQPS